VFVLNLLTVDKDNIGHDYSLKKLAARPEAVL
jgi:hypothetical protein